MDDSALRTYVRDHVTGAATVVRVARRRREREREPWVAGFVAELEGERDQLEQLVDDLGSGTAPRQAVGWAMERGAQVKLWADGRSDAALRDLLELELFRTGVAGKLCLWRGLAELVDDPRVARLDVEGLRAQGERQAAMLETHRLAAVRGLRG